MGSDVKLTGEYEVELCFNPHSRMGSDNMIMIGSMVSISFNPHSRMGSDKTAEKVAQTEGVSIHTPAWGVTYAWRCVDRFPVVSIHTPAWGVTWYRETYLFPKQSFNPHSRMGSDLLSFLYVGGPGHVSIHTPAWGVTLRHGAVLTDLKVSIHTPAWGVTRAIILCCGLTLFQSTLPHGE